MLLTSKVSLEGGLILYWISAAARSPVASGRGLYHRPVDTARHVARTMKLQPRYHELVFRGPVCWRDQTDLPAQETLPPPCPRLPAPDEHPRRRARAPQPAPQGPRAAGLAPREGAAPNQAPSPASPPLRLPDGHLGKAFPQRPSPGRLRGAQLGGGVARGRDRESGYQDLGRPQPRPPASAGRRPVGVARV